MSSLSRSWIHDLLHTSLTCYHWAIKAPDPVAQASWCAQKIWKLFFWSLCITDWLICFQFVATVRIILLIVYSIFWITLYFAIDFWSCRYTRTWSRVWEQSRCIWTPSKSNCWHCNSTCKCWRKYQQKTPGSDTTKCRGSKHKFNIAFIMQLKDLTSIFKLTLHTATIGHFL